MVVPFEVGFTIVIWNFQVGTCRIFYRKDLLSMVGRRFQRAGCDGFTSRGRVYQ
jgi:hypothetical protein